MKKVVFVLVMVGLVVGGLFQPAVAQEKKVNPSLNLGVQTNIWQGTSFDFAQFSLDFRAGIRISPSFEVSPEIMAVVHDDFEFDYVWLYPGVMLNYTPGKFFAGAGVVLPIAIVSGDSESGNPAPKINIGYRSGHLMLTAFFIMWTEESFFDFNFLGATIGYKF